MIAGGDLTFRSGTDIEANGATGVEMTLQAGGDFTAKKLQIWTPANSEGADVEVSAGGDLTLLSSNVWISGQKDIDLTLDADGDLNAKGAYIGAYSFADERVKLLSTDGDIVLRSADLEGKHIDVETCNEQRSGCSEEPTVDLRKIKFYSSADSFCVDGEDAEDAEDVDVRTARKPTHNGC